MCNAVLRSTSAPKSGWWLGWVVGWSGVGGALKPTVITYNTTISACAKGRQPVG